MKNKRNAKHTIGEYLLRRVSDLGVGHVFGVPGDYVLGLYQQIEHSPMSLVGTTREDCAGFAADAYARLRGVGVACVTYGVGGLNMVNPIACAFAERSPVILISGAPGVSERVESRPLHHMVGGFSTQQDIFDKITVATITLDDALVAEREIDHALTALIRYRRPIYIEVPRDMVHVPIEMAPSPQSIDRSKTKNDPATLAEALTEVRTMLEKAEKPLILAGVEMHRFGLQNELVRLAEYMNIPVVSTLWGKSVIAEDHPLYIGVYGGLIARDEIQQFVQESDCVLVLGSILTDIEDIPRTLPAFSTGQVIHATADHIVLKHHRYDHIQFEDFIHGLVTTPMPVFTSRPFPLSQHDVDEEPEVYAPVSICGVFAHLNHILNDQMLVIADIGDALFAAANLRIHTRTKFLSPAYYSSMGFAIPAAVGAGFASPWLRSIVLVGDGAFQMTGTELSTCLRFGQTPIVIVLNNAGYATEREILDGPFNDIQEWQYEKICSLVGGGLGHKVTTHGEFVKAIGHAMSDPHHLHVINVVLDKSDHSPAMIRLAKRLAENISPKDKPRTIAAA